MCKSEANLGCHSSDALHFSGCCLKTESVTGLELTELVRLLPPSSRESSLGFPSPVMPLQVCTTMSSLLFPTWVVGTELRSCSQGKHFTN